MYHGILLDLAFRDPNFPEGFKVFAKRKSSNNAWVLFGVEIPEGELKEAISNVQSQMKEDEPYYVHFYNDTDLIVVFKKHVFYVKPHIASWKPIIDYGRNLDIPVEQLDFWPNRFQDEKHYFKEKDYIAS